MLIYKKKLNKKDGNINRQFTTFLNKIEYFYVPAVRDRIFVQNLFLHFEKLIEHDSGKDFVEKMDELSNILKSKSEEISLDFEKFIGIPTRAALSSKASDLLGTVEINVQTGIKIVKRTKSDGKKSINVELNLFSSGDGILMSYLAYFLAHICRKISNKLFIWGFEEPENSLEYSKTQTLAEAFYDNFRNDAQILITTHSPAFIKLKDKPNVSFYRVYIDPEDVRQASKIKTLKEIEDRQRSLSESDISENEEYKKLTKELHFVEFAKEIEDAVDRICTKEKTLIESKNRFDKKYSSLLKTHPEKVFICEDSSKDTINFWKKMLDMFGISDVKVMSSDGCLTRNVEHWALEQQKLDINYKPKIFREIDRDGLTNIQIDLIEKKLNDKSKKLQFKLKFLPVHEIENFLVLGDKNFDKNFWKKKKKIISDIFENSAVEKATEFDKFFCYKEPAFRNNNGNYTSIMQTMRSEAENNWKIFFNGKEICKQIKNFEPVNLLLKLEKANLPSLLVDYMNVVKDFYEN